MTERLTAHLTRIKTASTRQLLFTVIQNQNYQMHKERKLSATVRRHYYWSKLGLQVDLIPTRGKGLTIIVYFEVCLKSTKNREEVVTFEWIHFWKKERTLVFKTLQTDTCTKISNYWNDLILFKFYLINNLFVCLRVCSEEAVKVKVPPKVIDTGGGFLLEEDPEDDSNSHRPKLVHPPGKSCVDCLYNFFYKDAN